MHRHTLTYGLAGLILITGTFALVKTLGQTPAEKAEPRAAATPAEIKFFGNKPGYRMGHITPGPVSPERPGTDSRVSGNLRVNDPQQPAPKGLLGRSETTLASSEDGRNILVGWNDVEGFLRPPFKKDGLSGPPGLNGFAFSTDGGATWTDGGAAPVVDHILSAGDPTMDRGGADKKTFYFATLTLDDRLPPERAALGVNVQRGHFGKGFQWDDVRLIRPPSPDDAYDRGVITAAKDGSGAAYVSVTNFRDICGKGKTRGRGQIEVWRTRDSGDTWRGPTVIAPDETSNTDPASPNCGKEGTFLHWATPAVGPRGEVYVVWAAGPNFGRDAVSTNARLMIARSDDGGAKFTKPLPLAEINSMVMNPPVAYDRRLMNDVPHIAVETAGRHKGRVYVTFYSAVTPVSTPPEQQSLISSQAYLTYSDDKAATWSTPTPLTPTIPPTGVKRFWPSVSTVPGGGVGVLYYESREAVADAAGCTAVLIDGGNAERKGPASTQVDTHYVQSRDGGATFGAPVKVSTATSNWCAVKGNIFPRFGDYIAGRVAGRRLLAAWTDGRNGVPDVFFATIDLTAASEGR
ncbi:MAG: exo-alpha-sialidase [Acidobacteria bacterium]|nr:exo-alpha-sialidase [Acidobacteriota bacterium]